MQNIPVIEWPESRDLEEENSVIMKTINLLKMQSEKKISTNQLFYFISPHPAYNIEGLIKRLSDLDLVNSQGKVMWDIVKYGHKNRGWGIIFYNLEILNKLLPVFFLHGAENLVIAAIEDSEIFDENGSALAEVARELVLGENDKPVSSAYTGLLFDGDCLVDIFDNGSAGQ